MPAAATFDFANAHFIPGASGDFRLDRDWANFPPTAREVEALFGYGQLVGDLLTSFMDFYGNKIIVPAGSLSDDQQRALSRYLDVVAHVMGTQTGDPE